jgi:2-C-methyl-D-erythritol 4-phosphate cytidylyltransferase/2-C-methyl-D-erythritol 2,4-cyclodiphosphate synthase
MAGVAAVVVAAGRGERAGEDRPKQFRRIGDEVMLRRTLATLAGVPEIGVIQPVIRPEHGELYDAAATGLDLQQPAFGGATRQASVRAGLEALAAHEPDFVLVHDAARPFATPALIARAVQAARDKGAAVPALPVADTNAWTRSRGRLERRWSATRPSADPVTRAWTRWFANSENWLKIQFAGSRSSSAQRS